MGQQKTSLSVKSSSEPTTSHKIRLTELDPNTTYHYTVISIDASGNEAAFAEDKTFKTLQAIPVGYQEGNRAPEFTLQDLSGKNLSLSAFQGKIVMVNFWATWCNPCTRELPYFQEIQASESWPDDKLVILAINLKEPQEAVNSFITNKNYTFTVLLDSNGEVSTLYKVTGIPKTFFIDADGIIREIKSGSFQNSEQIEEKLKSTD